MAKSLRASARVADTVLEDLLAHAAHVRENAYAPYSRIRVGAAVLSSDSGIFTGCNVENVSYGLTICAERAAVFDAICSGARHVNAIAVTCGTNSECLPCGACLQVLSEFDHTDIIIVTGSPQAFQRRKLSELLPSRFKNAHTLKE